MGFSEEDPDTVICPACTVTSVLQSSEAEFDMDKERAKIVRKRAIKNIARLNVHEVLDLKLLVILMCLIVANFYVNYYIEKSGPTVQANLDMIQDAGNPVLEMSLYMAGVFNYSADHSGRYPEKLDDLYPKYMDKERSNIVRTEDQYQYAVDSKSGFVISIPIADRFGFKKIFVSRDGVIRID
jgi:hypothetical protein